MGNYILFVPIELTFCNFLLISNLCLSFIVTIRHEYENRCIIFPTSTINKNEILLSKEILHIIIMYTQMVSIEIFETSYKDQNMKLFQKTRVIRNHHNQQM